MAQFFLFGFIGLLALVGLAPIGYALWSVAIELPAIITECLSFLTHGSDRKWDIFGLEKTTVWTVVFYFCKKYAKNIFLSKL